MSTAYYYADGVEAHVGDHVVCVDSSDTGGYPIFNNLSNVFKVLACYTEAPDRRGRCDIRRVCDGLLSRNWYTARFIKVGPMPTTTQTRRLTVKAINSK